MRKTQFMLLPNFVREQIIEYVIAVNKSYCTISKEWLEYTMNYYVTCDMELYNQNHYPSFISQYVESLKFETVNEIDWAGIFDFRCIKRVTLHYEDDFNGRNVLLNQYILSMSPLTSLTLNLECVRDLNSTRYLLQANGQHLKELELYTSQFKQFHIIKNIKFPSLVSFSYDSYHETSTFYDISNNMPNLKNLCIRKKLDIHTFIFDQVFETVTELRIIDKHYGYQTDTLDLLNFPSLKRLIFHGRLNFENTQECRNLEELTAELFDESLYLGLSDQFFHLKRLSLTIRNEIDINELKRILPLCTSLYFLHLNTNSNTNLNNKLPPGLFLVTALKLSGSLVFDNTLLNWLSSNFRLRHLELNLNETEPSYRLNRFPFEYLRHVIFRASHRESMAIFREYAANSWYSEVDFFEFIEVDDLVDTLI